MNAPGLQHAITKMKTAGVKEAAINVFSHYYHELQAGATGLIPENTIKPLHDLPHMADMPTHAETAQDVLARTVMIKLNGGLGTTMGMDKAKSLLPVRDGKRFIDIICDQVRAIRRQWNVSLPLIFMNSFRTHSDTMEALADYPDITVGDIPVAFIQNQEPKLLADTLAPVSWPADPTLEWCPPGHGDIYPALMDCGLLSTLIDHGYRYAMVSNSDNLGATITPALAQWFAGTAAPFCMEVCRRTKADRKGGHLALNVADGALVLRETAQTSPEDMRFFSDIWYYRFFNTNNLWLDLQAVHDLLEANNGVLGLPMICNKKTVDPTDPTSPAVIQIETAMGTAISVFDGALAVEVPRSRFLPVKSTSDLLIVASDIYELDSMSHLNKVTGMTPLPNVQLDERFFKNISDFIQRFPDGAPSLKDATGFSVSGDHIIDADLRVVGTVHIS